MAHMARFTDWNKGPQPGFWCQWSGILSVVGSNSLSLWNCVTGTYLLFVFFRKIPGAKFEIIALAIWPLFTVLPATIPYAFYPAASVYSPLPTGQCFFTFPELTAYFMIFWDAFLLIYILVSYIAVSCQLYYVSKQLESALNILQPEDKDKMKKFWMTLAVSPAMYWIFYICLIISRIMEFAKASVSLEFIRASVVVYICVGFFNSLWFGYSNEIYVKAHKKCCWCCWEDLEEGLYIN